MVTGRKINFSPSFLAGHSQNDIETVGLVFGPNFFTAYFYSDQQALSLIAIEKMDWQKLELLSGIEPAFALDFSRPFTLVPSSINNEENAGSLLRFNTSSEGKEVNSEKLIGLDLVVISESNIDLETLLKKQFPGLALNNGITALLEYSRKVKPNSNGNSIFLHQSAQEYALVVFTKKGLQLANTIHAEHLEDVRYFFLYSLHQLGLKADQEIYLLGQAIKNTGLRSLLAKYATIDATPQISASDINWHAQSPQLRQEHWPGFYASLCAL